MLKQQNPNWNRSPHLAKDIIFWTNLLEQKLLDKDSCIYVMRYIPQLRAQAWLEFGVHKPAPTIDELCCVMEWVEDEEIRIDAFKKMVALSPSEEDYRYIIQWIPAMRFIVGYTWINTGITPNDLVYVFENVPEIQTQLHPTTLKYVILSAQSPQTKLNAGKILIQQSQSLDTLLFLKENVPEMEPVILAIARQQTKPKNRIGFQFSEKTEDETEIKKS